MQPYRPFLNVDLELGFEYPPDVKTAPGSHWGRLRSGEISLEEAKSAFRSNTKVVLDDVEVLLQNIDVDTVAITADHGECLDEYGIYGHHSYVPIPVLRRVPWYTTNATDDWKGEQTYAASKRFQDLGYL